MATKLIAMYNLYKGGSKTIYNNICSEISKNKNVYQLTSHEVVGGTHSIKYPIKRLNKFYRVYLDHIYTAILGRQLNVDHLIVMGNFPCIFWLKQQTCYFHNTLYLDHTTRSITHQIEVFLFKLAHLLKPKTKIFVQTEVVRQRLLKAIKNKNIEVCPLFTITPLNLADRNIHKSNEQLTFFYPASLYEHKNHTFLVNVFRKLPAHTLILTLPPKAINVSNNVKLIGEVIHEIAMKQMCEADAMIFPSLTESLGLPLLEAVANQVPIIAPDLDYVNAVIEDYYAFDPTDPKCLLEAISIFETDRQNKSVKLPRSKIKCDTSAFVKALING